MSWVEEVEALTVGSPCEWRFPARTEWQRGTVVVAGGSSYWTVKDENGAEHGGLYIEHIKAVGGPSSSEVFA
jgi:hypothetical protein